MLAFDRDLNKQLMDYLQTLARKANDSDITDGGVIIGNIDITGDLSGTGTFTWTGDGSFSGTFAAGAATFTGAVTVPDEAYTDVGWNGDLTVPTKNAIRDIWVTLGTAAFEATGTSGHTLPFLDGANTFSAQQIISTGSAALGTPLMLYSDNPDNLYGPILELRRDTASPAVGDLVGRIAYNGRSSTGVLRNLAALDSQFIDPTNGSEDTRFMIATLVAGSAAYRMRVDAGVYHPSVSGGDKGDNTLNFGTIYQNNVPLGDAAFEDYEEGTFTPSFSGTGLTIGSYTVQSGVYTRIGNMVYFVARLQIGTSGNTLAANAIFLDGLPFSALAGSTQYMGSVYTGSTTNMIVLTSRFPSGGGTQIEFRHTTAATTSQLTNITTSNQLLHATNGTSVAVFGWYQI